jgi:CheY-like chemotaxis protein
MNMIMPHFPKASAQSSAYTVLVVEDDVMVRMPIAEYLRDCGYIVLEAGDAAEAIAAMGGAGRVNVVFSDIRMPGPMDGFGLARWLQNNHPDIPILLTSGYNSSRSLSIDVARGVKLIEKPYSQAHVARRIQDLLEQ